ncbi:MAG: tRNA (guanosine(46)-N(7))-methyltransferase TrmB [Alphaproteobacteria bacterium]
MLSKDTKTKFYGRRQGKKIRQPRVNLLKNLLPQIAINKNSLKDTIDINNLFSFKPEQLWLEVGFGGGEHTSEQALNNPKTAIIASEVFVNGIASLLAHLAGTHSDGTILDDESCSLETRRSDNVRIFPDDVRLLFPFLPDACFDRIFVLFPDPWPKKRHALRRFIGPDNLPELRRLLKVGGELRVASDDMNYIRWSLEHLNKNPYFEWLATNHLDWKTPPKDWVQTRYEQKALSKGDKPVYLRFQKKS